MKHFVPILKALTYRVAYSRDKNKLFAFISQALHHVITYKVPYARYSFHLSVGYLSYKSSGQLGVCPY
jgi:hypothetical protein